MRKVHLVGSIPLADSTTVMQQVSQRLGDRLARIPDGETGDRKLWVQWQTPVIENNVFFEPAGEVFRPHQAANAPVYRQYKLREGVDPQSVRFGALGYAHCAKQSYQKFLEMKKRGVIRASTAFMVAFPTPPAFLGSFVRREDARLVEGAYVRRLESELDDILSFVQHDELAIQWDTVHEIIVLEGAREGFVENPRDGFLSRLAHLGNIVPEPVQLGYHFCYGDGGHKHATEPKDMGLMIDLLNELAPRISRKIDFVHMPVPRDRDDPDYFEPLRRLDESAAKELYLGLIHYTDGLEGTQRRLAQAAKFHSGFGIGTECGFGRRDPETVLSLLELHDAASKSQ